jgi:hypothetical protein
MALRTVEWVSYNRLSCAGCTPADVFICTTFDELVISGQLVSFTVVPNQCGQKFFRYVFSYDTDDLPIGNTGLVCSNITGVFCQGCMTQWIEQEIADVVVDVTGLQTQIDALEVVDADLQVQIDVLEANPRAVVFQGQAFELGFSWIVNPGADFDLDLIVTNPSAVNSMAVDADWGWDLSLVSGIAYSPTGASSILLQDAVLVANSGRDASENWTPGGIRTVNFTGGTGHHHFILAPGGSTTLTLRLSPAGGGPPAPDTGWSAEHIYLSAFGVTI